MTTEHAGRRDVIQAELAWHEQEAHRRYSLDELLYDPPAFDAVVGPAIDFLAATPGERVLDMGCGEGKETFALAARGLTVISTDLSHVQLARARERVRDGLPDARAHFVQANAEELPFVAGAFRVIYGKAILHHLDLDLAAAEVDRLLPPGGRATFAEPLPCHPIIVFGRRLTPRLRTKGGCAPRTSARLAWRRWIASAATSPHGRRSRSSSLPRWPICCGCCQAGRGRFGRCTTGWPG